MQAYSSTGGDPGRLQRLTYNRTGFWLALLLALAGLAGFVLFFNLGFPALGDNLSDPVRIGLGLILSVVPAALWLFFFYRLDRLEPEPKSLVISVYLLGVLLMAACYEPVLQQFFTIDRWLYEQWWTRLLGGILIVGCFEQLLVYLTVRVSVFTQTEFDERMDGMIYAVAAGLGLATVLNFRYVVKHGGVDLDIGSIRMVINALALASFAGVQGYFIGQTRFERTPVYYLPGGLLLAATLNGLFFYILEQAAGNTLTLHPWRDLIVAAVVAVSTLTILFWLMARANEETLRVARQLQAALPEVGGSATASREGV